MVMELKVYRRIVLALLTMVVATFAPSAKAADHPRWALHWNSGKGDFYIDQPSCHPVAYFAGNPKQFDYGYDLFGMNDSEISDRVETEEIGTISGYAIKEINHTINDGDLIMKMILVERTPETFCEIYHQQHSDSVILVGPAFIVELGSEKILATTDRVSGNGAFKEENYWTFGENGPLDLQVVDQIRQIVKSLLPEGLAILNGSGFEIRSLTYSMPVWSNEDGHCCPSGGRVDKKFTLENHRLRVLSQSFQPN